MFSVNQIANDYFKYMQTKPNYVSAEILFDLAEIVANLQQPSGSH